MKMFTFLLAAFLQQNIFAHGGISGGGGNTINPKAPLSYQDPKMVKDLIQLSVGDFEVFLKQKKSQLKSGVLDEKSAKLYAEIFRHEYYYKPSEIKLKIPLDHPCIDLNGNSFDGSSLNVKFLEKMICISAFQFAKKVDVTEVKKQAIALMIHEYAEVYGLDDEEAILLQTEALKEL